MTFRGPFPQVLAIALIVQAAAARGVCPHLITLRNGIIVCSYSRPGAWLIFSDDNGQTWKGPTQFGPNNNYIYLVDVGPDTIQTFRENSGHTIIATHFTVRKKP